MASSSSRRVSDGLNAMAFGSVLVSGGVAAGVEVAASAALKVRSQQRTQNEVSLIHEFSTGWPRPFFPKEMLISPSILKIHKNR